MTEMGFWPLAAPHGPKRRRFRKLPRELAISQSLAIGDGEELVPHSFLKRRALGIERKLETLAPACEIRRDLPLGFSEQRIPLILHPIGIGYQGGPTRCEAEPAELFVFRSDEHFAKATREASKSHDTASSFSSIGWSTHSSNVSMR